MYNIPEGATHQDIRSLRGLYYKEGRPGFWLFYLNTSKVWRETVTMRDELLRSRFLKPIPLELLMDTFLEEHNANVA